MISPGRPAVDRFKKPFLMKNEKIHIYMCKFLSDFAIIYSARIEKDLKTNPQGKNNKVNEQSTFHSP